MSRESRQKVEMPKWPAWVLLGVMGACAFPVLTLAAPAEQRIEAPSGGAAQALPQGVRYGQ